MNFKKSCGNEHNDIYSHLVFQKCLNYVKNKFFIMIINQNQKGKYQTNIDECSRNKNLNSYDKISPLGIWN